MQKFILLLWFMAGAFSSIYGQTPTIGYTYDSNGNRTSRYIVSVRSGASSFKRDMQQPVAQIADGQQTISIYPNPTKGIFAIGITGLDSQAENYYVLYNMQGKQLRYGSITSDRTSIDITWDAVGMYLLDVSLGGNVSKWKIVKQ
ncbi:T9SS type A sorting domain-containing protein [Paludibacter sp.]|uniref:T9SS type A sorting domain-containing protein n=1 Tax=Paludibacter sp. TaxID=1898105 RepID=UPI001352CC0F|nr:T9SS type A sorting domain-containing protein [Paludibacter sp.]MTK53337.1 T9SS type A sorting domain-containing protein [Paludibacter sp.]